MPKTRFRFDPCGSWYGAHADRVTPSNLGELVWPNSNHRRVRLTFNIVPTA